MQELGTAAVHLTMATSYFNAQKVNEMNGNQSRTLKVGDPRWKTATTDRGTISWDCLERSFRLTGMTVIRLQSSKTIWVRSSGCLGKLVNCVGRAKAEANRQSLCAMAWCLKLSAWCLIQPSLSYTY